MQHNKQQKNITSKSTVHAATLVAVFSFISKILGFIKQLLIGNKFGATGITDAYLVSLSVPTVLFATISNAISATYIPVCSDIEAEEGKVRVNNFTSNLINTICVIAVAISIIGMIFAKPLVKIIAIGFSGEVLEMAIKFTRAMMLMCVFLGISSITSGYLKAHYQFTTPIMTEMFNKIILIGALLTASLTGIWGLVIATVLGAAAKAVIELLATKRNGFSWHFKIDFKDRELLNMVSLTLPVIMSIGVNQINPLMDKMLASNLADGSILALNLANILNGFAYGLITISISTVIYPTLSRFSIRSEVSSFKKLFNNAVSFLITIIMPLTFGAMVIRVPVVRFLFERGAFDCRATHMTATALLYYSIGMIGFGLRNILERSFYSLQDTKTPMINGVMVVGINIVLNLVLVKFMGLGGLALATSISAIIGTILLFYHLRKKIGSLGGKKVVISFLKAFVSSVVMGIVVKYFYDFISLRIVPDGILNQGIDLGLTITLGAIVYIGMSFLLKMDEIYLILKVFKGKR